MHIHTQNQESDDEAAGTVALDAELPVWLLDVDTGCAHPTADGVSPSCAHKSLRHCSPMHSLVGINLCSMMNSGQ
jgi:hypothetical protein